MELGARIKQARKAARLTQVGLAIRLGVAQSTISKWENDQLDPTARQLLAISEATGKPLPWFLEGVAA